MRWILCFGYVVLLEVSLVISECIIPSFENLTVQSNFNLNKFLGVWYEIKWLPSAQEDPADIWRNFYQSFQLQNSTTQKLVVPGQARTLNSQNCFPFGPWLINANNGAKMILEKQDINNTQLLNWPYYILQTDYDHYALVYACRSTNYTSTDPCTERVLWLFSRSTTLSNSYTSDLDRYIESSLCVNLTALEITPQEGQSCYSSSNRHLINLILFVFLFLLYI
jgi:lipocalin